MIGAYEWLHLTKSKTKDKNKQFIHRHTILKLRAILQNKFRNPRAEKNVFYLNKFIFIFVCIVYVYVYILII